MAKPRTRERGATSEHILVAAEKLFVERGFRGTSVHDIAAAAGYTTGAIYSSFGGKDDLFLAVFRRKAEQQEAVWRAALADITTPAEAAAAMGSAMAVGRLEHSWYAVAVEFLSYAAREDRLRREAAEIYRRGTAMVLDVLGGLAWDSPLDADRLAPVVVALLRGLALTWFVDPDSVDERLFSDAVAVLLGTPPGADAT
jgi:AcrR family transcriptional regulator